MKAPLFDSPVVFVDIETTGGHPGHSRIMEIGLVAAIGDTLEYEWSTLINPGMTVPPTIQHFTGITDEMLRQAPFFEDVMLELADHLHERLFVAHNARFDYGFIRQEFRRAGIKFSSRVACTVKLSRRLNPDMPRHNLDALIERHGLQCDRRHRALPDAQALWQYWQVLRNTRTFEEVETALRAVTQLSSLPAHLPANLVDELPEGPGVYRFYGQDDALLYVGKGNNIRQRVLSHWQACGADAKSQRLAELTRRIDWTLTAGELGALLLESRLVRELKPIYNRKLRGSSQSFTWLISDDGAAPTLAPLDQLQLSFENADAFGLFRTQAEAKKLLLAVARENNLCLKVLGLEASSGSCFGYQLERCAGACVGEESLRKHALKLKMALASERLKTWPFDGPIGVREDNGEGLEQIYVIDDWRHVATLEKDDAPLPYGGRPQTFQIDVYKILLRYFADKRKARILKFPKAQEKVEEEGGCASRSRRRSARSNYKRMGALLHP